MAALAVERTCDWKGSEFAVAYACRGNHVNAADRVIELRASVAD